MKRKGMPTFTAYSPGSHPSGSVRPGALSKIENAGLSTENFRSKSWDEFSKPDSPSLDFVFTVCDNAANEVCPLWPVSVPGHGLRCGPETSVTSPLRWWELQPICCFCNCLEISIPSSKRWKCGNPEGIPGGVVRVASRFYGFPCFPLFVISTVQVWHYEVGRLWVLKNSLCQNLQKIDRVRMPYKRFVEAA